MPNPFLVASSLLLLVAAPAAAPAGVPDWKAVTLSLQQEQQRVTIQVPRVTITSSATIIVRRAPHVVEKKAKDCVKVQDISGFAGVNTQDSVDLVLRDGSLLRAKLGRKCQALGFYNGFYVKTNKDQKICAGRDSIRTRAGRSCDVEDFRALALER
ncbi:hypothetical protein OMP43_15240 [Sphingomonas sp. CBMAI 2297]|uniref:hypothetical protein n=1 Tax=Sphingomonas sp. CBMAI 2297 TaxID=2991720 RepID=UPI0024553235|nr:hypothetical protein [Sphingomonas sp. CBMAI 2297]MDH4745375.1 hypothetical protein [Sphingomonas sp. CBMAI 2297]